MEEYFDLLKSWCDALVRHQLTQLTDPGLYGAILCPACSAVHGRCHGAVYPLLFLASQTKEEGYVRCAERLIEWSEHMAQPDGGYVNDTMCEWKGTTVFAAVCFAKAYPYAGLLKPEAFRKFDAALKGFLSYLYEVFDISSGNINYVAGAACALELGGKLYHREDYRRRANEYAHSMLAFTTESGLIYGEGGTGRDAVSRKGCLPVDLGYNLEETIPLLADYASSAGDSYLQSRLASIARTHLMFLLPDGGIDNSTGTRMDKWTYWGSRTSDGCAAGLLRLSGFDEEFIPAALKSLRLLKECTHDGLLYGGPDVYAQGEPPCIHHTFTHAAGLAGALEWMQENRFRNPQLKAAEPSVSRYFPEMDVYLQVFGDWRATITGYDNGEKKYCAPSGGAISLLYHRLSGPVFVSGMTRYERYEIMNTQRHMDGADTPLTMRLQKDMGIWKSNIALTPVIRAMGEVVTMADILDKEAVIRKNGENTYEVNGKISADCDSEKPRQEEAAKAISFQKLVRFLPDRVQIVWKHDGEHLSLYLPAVASRKDALRVEDGVCEIEKENCTVKICSSAKFDPLCAGRIYSHVPGFHAVPLKISDVPSGTVIEISVY